MDYVIHDFRHASKLLQDHPAWLALDEAIRLIDREGIIAVQRRLGTSGARVPKGGQIALNLMLADLLREEDGWTHQPRLFRSQELELWKMDFLRERVGVEVSFNHAEAIPWQFTRLNIAGESERVIPESRIDVGVVITASRSLKAWARMDSAVGTFDRFESWLREMKPILPIPIQLVGLEAEGWEVTDVFAGTAQGTRTSRAVGGELTSAPTGEAASNDHSPETTP